MKSHLTVTVLFVLCAVISFSSTVMANDSGELAMQILLIAAIIPLAVSGLLLLSGIQTIRRGNVGWTVALLFLSFLQTFVCSVVALAILRMEPYTPVGWLYAGFVAANIAWLFWIVQRRADS